ncbi:MAG: T9SS type A sorting domain-containing protein [candidate division KSB1 bacterium]|nr:T9SS type A sorting domain-containing protein [candidate division KSB1 bacterium]MDZ7369061.1 T9SS type A sorting domain-containing protein [candidate division KSB1 bacterium]MDZ7407286.1 T9SS type A sorting domain-containing protein [candidate division KSB1 bacterium]
MRCRRQIFSIIVFACLTGASFVFAGDHAVVATATVDTFYVSPAGSNLTGTGAKSNPWRSLAFAMNKLASDSLHPKVIKLANGVYSASTTGEVFPIVLKSWISLIGSDNLNTVIDANRSERVLIGQNTATILIAQLTIRNGLTRADSSDDSRGGGLLLRNCRQIVITNCALRANEAKTLGGGVFLDGGSDISLENNFMEKNLAVDGGAIYCHRTKSAKFIANLIQYNTAQNSAGGIYIDRASPVVQRNRIRWNNANPAISKNSGGIIVRSGNPIIGGSLGTGNDIHNNLGGTFASQLQVIDNTTPVNARYNYWGDIPTSSLVLPAAFVDLSNYRNIAINIALGTSEFYVAPHGSDENNGAPTLPWRTLGYAFTQIFATGLDSLTIILHPGIYSASTTGEPFPIYPKSRIAIVGATSIQAVKNPAAATGAAAIISGENVSNHELIRLQNVNSVRLANLVFRNYKSAGKTSVIRARSSSDVIIENCIFEDNQSQRGAAITLIETKSAEIRHNVFRRNHSSDFGGAVALVQDASVFSGNLFVNNSASEGGGAVLCDSTSETRFSKNQFQNNTAGYGGALYVSRSNVRVFSNRFLSNLATLKGGAIALDGASQPLIGTRDSQANDIYLNTAMKSGSQIQRLEPGIKVDVRYNYWGQIPDSTALSPFGQFASENFRQVASRMPSDTKEIYVSPSGNDAATGTSRSQALRTVGEALQLIFGTEKKPLTLRLLPGKFAASTNGDMFPLVLENYLIWRGAGRDSTTLDAENGSRVFEGHNLVGSVISGLNIVGGNTSGHGGAILVKTATTAAAKKTAALTIENCLLQSNSAAHGGAVAAVRNYKTLIRNCVITNNRAQQNGGAVLALGDSVEIKDSVLSSNRATKDGGAAQIDSAAVVTLINNRLYKNIATYGGGVAVMNGIGRMWRNFIIDNWAHNGGGIYLSANAKATIGGSSSNGNDIYGNAGKELSSAPRGDRIEARFNYFGGKPGPIFIDNPAGFETSNFRYVTITAPEKNREFFISPKGHDDNSGASKNSPWKTVTAALRRFFTEPGDSVRLHLLNGIYSASTNGEQFPLRLPHRVSLIGQNPDSVVFDGENKTRLLDINFVIGVHVRNLSILNGNGTTPVIQPLSAGGVRVHRSALVYFDRVVFRGNKTNGDGGAMAADSSQQFFITNSRFLENQGRGGAIFFHRIGGEIRACEFRQNCSPGPGSAIYLHEASPQISGNIIVGNEAAGGEIGGAIFCGQNSLPVIGGAAGRGNDIYNNTGGGRGQILARQGNSPVINATHNYLSNSNITETLVSPLNGFDLNFSRKVSITNNSKPIITQISPAANEPLRASRFDTVRFGVTAYDPDNDFLTYSWMLNDGVSPVGFGANYNFYPFFAGPGEHRVRVVVSDQKDTVMVHWKVVVSTTNVNERTEWLPKTFALQQNFPNPLRSDAALTVLPYQIPKQTEVILAVYDVLGRRVRLLERSQKAGGFYSAIWDGLDESGLRVKSGLYLVRMQAGEFSALRKIVVTR